MPLLHAALLLLATLLAVPNTATAQHAHFSHPVIARDAERYEAYLKGAFRPATGPVAPLREQALRQLATGSDPRGAAGRLATVVITDARDAAAWLGLARALLAITPDPERPAERTSIPVNASGAAYIALERAPTDAIRADALAALGEALKRRSLWRPAIDALAASVRLADKSATRQLLDELRAEHGFRVVDYKSESDAAEPRLCINFSERLPATAADLAKFVTVDGVEPQGLASEGSQLCVDGLKHGQRYQLLLRAGLPSAAGETLAKSAEIGVYVRDRSPSVRFTGRAYVLPSRGQHGIPIVSVNAARAKVEILRVGDRGLAGATSLDGFLKQVQPYELESIRERAGQRVWAGELEIVSRLNQEVTTALPVRDAVASLSPGVYLIVATPAGGTSRDERQPATQWFIVSDLGLTALTGEDGVHAFVRSIASAAPAGGVTLRLVARNSEILAEQRTDANGYVRFDPGLAKGKGGQAAALLVAEADGDYAFLELATAAFDLTDRGVKGREMPGALDAYLYTERGVYRPGETVHLTGLVRDAAGVAATLPTTLVVTRPDGVEHRRLVMPDQGLGGRHAALALAPTVMTGTWRARLHADLGAKPLAQAAFLVEDFVPERLALTLTPAGKALAVEETGAIDVAGRYLYGPPAANLALEGEILVRAATGDVPGYPGYRFGQDGERITTVRQPLEALPATDADGRARIGVRLPPIPRTSRPLEAEVMVRLRESGGRAIERRVTLPVDTREPRVGIRPLFQGGEIGEGETAQFEVLLLDADGKPVPSATLKWELVRLDRRWQWYSRDGQWSYDAVTTTRRIATGNSDIRDGKPARIEARPEWGRYRLEVSSTDPRRPAVTSLAFNAGWHASEAADSPEVLDIALDKSAYRAGDTARVRINTRLGGKVRIAVLSSGLLAVRDADLPAGGGEVTLPVDAAWMPGVYVTAMMYRPMDEAARRMPSRAIGVRWLAVDTSAATLKVTLAPPARAKPMSRLSVPVRIEGLGAGEEARITVAAVDQGILSLTGFEAPAPDRHFLAQRRMGIEIRDLYGRLIDGMRAERGTLRSGGDGPGSGMSMRGSPPAEKPLALFSGIVPVRPDGTAEVSFDLPDFNGTVRLMAVAWSRTRTGSAGADTIVRDALALTVTAPRFLTLGDEAWLSVDLHNVEGPADTYALTIEKEAPGAGPVSLAARSPRLAAGERRADRVSIKPAVIGLHHVAVRLTGPGGIEVRRRIALDVKAPANDIRRTIVSRLQPRGGRVMLTDDLLTDLIPASTRISLAVGPSASFDVPGLVNQLDRYPYGCAEQTVSRALPLLYLSDVARGIGLAAEPELKARVAKAIDRVLEMQDATGAFGTWGPAEPDLWLTGYVADFLTRAKEAGHAVPHRSLAQALDRLAGFISYAQDFKSGGEDRAYALYVLARNGRAPVGDLRYYADTRLDRFATPLARAQLGAALAMTGDRERADRALRSALALLSGDGNDEMRADYGSRLRDGAAVLTLASETRMIASETPALTSIVERALQGRQHTSTQEQAWMLLAARALGEEAKATRLSIRQAPHQGELVRSLAASDLRGGGLEIVNTGEAATTATLTVIGAALTPEPAIAKGFTITRSFHRLDGTAIAAENGALTIRQNERVVVVIKLSGETEGGRVLLVDRLPAGIEIENPRLLESGEPGSLAWLDRLTKAEHAEFRDDRFVAAFNFFGGGNGGATRPAATVAYIARAVSAGRFVLPAAQVEDMYRPERYARTGAGRLEVTMSDRR